nr:reverse transcriptase domain-containing protein [Tanacetum cinerariifolium]
MRRVGKCFSGVETPLFEGMLVVREITEEGIAEEQVQADDAVAAAVQETVAEDVANEAISSTPTPLILPSPPSHDIPSTSQVQSLPHQQPQSSPHAPPQGAKFLTHLFQQVLYTCSALTRRVENLKHDKAAQKLEIIKLKARYESEVQKVVEVITTAKLITEIVTAATSQVSAVSAIISATKPKYARKLHKEINKHHEEINKDIDWDVAIDHVKQKSKENRHYIKQYQVMKKRPQTESEARKNMMIYLKNTAGYKLDFFKGMPYDEIRPIFQARFDANMSHKISKNGIEVDKAKVDVIAKLPHPTTVKGIRSFLGHAGFYRRFIQDFSKIARPMTRLLEKDTPFFFSKECIEAFQTLKRKLTEAPILVAPDWDLPFELICDVSDFAICAVLGQRKTKHFQPIHYESKTMADAQDHYITTEKELLSVVYAFEKFWPYLVLSKSKVYTDHSVLKYQFNKKDAKPRLLR